MILEEHLGLLLLCGLGVDARDNLLGVYLDIDDHQDSLSLQEVAQRLLVLSEAIGKRGEFGFIITAFDQPLC